MGLEDFIILYSFEKPSGAGDLCRWSRVIILLTLSPENGAKRSWSCLEFKVGRQVLFKKD